MRLLTSKDGNLSSCFDKNGESAFDDNNVLKPILINKNTTAIKRKYRGRLELEHIFGFGKTFKKIAKSLGFHLTFKTANPQDIILKQ